MLFLNVLITSALLFTPSFAAPIRKNGHHCHHSPKEVSRPHHHKSATAGGHSHLHIAHESKPDYQSVEERDFELEERNFDLGERDFGDIEARSPEFGVLEDCEGVGKVGKKKGVKKTHHSHNKRPVKGGKKKGSKKIHHSHNKGSVEGGKKKGGKKTHHSRSHNKLAVEPEIAARSFKSILKKIAKGALTAASIASVALRRDADALNLS